MMLDLWPGQLVPTSPYDQECRELADHHYSRQSIGAPQFAGNGPKLVLRDTQGDILWVWLNEQQPRWDGQTGYYCQIFRNESSRRSSEIILEAEQHAITKWGPARMFTYIDPAAVKSTNPGYCYLMAGWHPHGYSKKRKRRLLVKYDDCGLDLSYTISLASLTTSIPRKLKVVSLANYLNCCNTVTVIRIR